MTSFLIALENYITIRLDTFCDKNTKYIVNSVIVFLGFKHINLILKIFLFHTHTQTETYLLSLPIFTLPILRQEDNQQEVFCKPFLVHT